eukprot:1797232-Pyramimonas_sp.AAC.1
MMCRVCSRVEHPRRHRSESERRQPLEWATRKAQAPEDTLTQVPRSPDGYHLDPIRALFVDVRVRIRCELVPLARPRFGRR